MKIFIAAPLFSEAEREFNSKIAKKLRAKGFEVWLAQENQFIKQETHKEKNKIYENDILTLKSSDVVIAILDGVEVDSGVAFEIGYAKASGKEIVGLKTDYRTFSITEEVNIMLEVPLIKICKNIDDLIDFLYEKV